MLQARRADGSWKALPAADAAARFLRELAGGGAVAQTILIVLAHPDDETLAVGGHLPRLVNAHLMVVTDGAPRGRPDAADQGFASAEAYAAARHRELVTALALAGWDESRLTRLAFPDQESVANLAPIARAVAALVRERQPDIVITHAYEGGHPDHDATAFAVHNARRLLEDEGLHFGVIEAPLYRFANGGWERQTFVPNPEAEGTAFPLDASQRRLKRRMLAAHGSQQATLREFVATVERFRPAPAYDFAVLPNDGALLYEAFGWGSTGTGWLMAVRDAEVDLFGAGAWR